MLVYKIIDMKRKASRKTAADASGHDLAAPGKKNDKAGWPEKLILAAVLFAAAVMFAAIAPDYTLMRAGMFPLIMALVMAISLVFILAAELRGMILFAKSKDSIGVRGNEWSQYVSTLAFMLAYTIVLILFGFYFTNLIMPIVFFKRFQKASLKKSLVLGCLFAIGVYLIFNIAFKMILFPGAIPMIIPNYLGGGSLRPFF
jgi:hypothetical protein